MFDESLFGVFGTSGLVPTSIRQEGRNGPLVDFDQKDK
jgi:hypothetical protein